jgi:hypothetical protein
MMSYPIEQQKGRYFAWFWAIFNVGACIGSLVESGDICMFGDQETNGVNAVTDSAE